MTVLSRNKSSSSSSSSAFFFYSTWILLSFGAHSLASRVFHTIKHGQQSDTADGVIWFSIFLLTFFQLCIGGVAMAQLEKILSIFSDTSLIGRRRLTRKKSVPLLPLVIEKNGNRPSASCSAPTTPLTKSASTTFVEMLKEDDDTAKMPLRLQIQVALMHLLGNLATNAAIAFAGSTPTLAIRTLEPLTATILSTLIIPEKNNSTFRLILAAPLVTIGAIGMTWRSTFNGAAYVGIAIAFFSNFALNVRNFGLRKAVTAADETATPFASRIRVSALMSVSAMMLLVWMVLAQVTLRPGVAFAYFANGSDNFYNSLISGICHLGFSLTATVFANTLQSKACRIFCNLGSSIALSVIFIAFDWQYFTVINFAFSLLYLSGLIFFVLSLKPFSSQ